MTIRYKTATVFFLKEQWVSMTDNLLCAVHFAMLRLYRMACYILLTVAVALLVSVERVQMKQLSTVAPQGKYVDNLADLDEEEYGSREVLLESSKSFSYARFLWSLPEIVFRVTRYCLTASPGLDTLTACPVQKDNPNRRSSVATGLVSSSHSNKKPDKASGWFSWAQPRFLLPRPFGLGVFEKTTTTLTVNCISASLAQTSTCPGCTTNSSCPSTAPYCNTQTGVCKECLTSLHCPTNKPVCQSSGMCSACTADSECPTSRPTCNRSTGSCDTCPKGVSASGTCQECSSQSDCPSTKPVCKLGSCSRCTANSECPSTASKCDTGTGTCKECLVQSDCPSSKPACKSNTCLPCSSDSDCPSSANKCDKGTGACRKCTNADCPSASPNCNKDGVCFACSVDSDCPAASPVCNSPACIPCANALTVGQRKLCCYDNLYMGKKYCFGTHKVNKDDANATCENASMKLLGLGTEEENNAIVAKIKADPGLQSPGGSPFYYFIGLTKGAYNWETGESIMFNNFVPSSNPFNNCFAIASTSKFKWSLIDCTSENYFVCEGPPY